LQLRAQGYAGASLLYDQTNNLSMSSPTFIEFNFAQVDSVMFSTIPPENVFVMDNITTTNKARFSATPTSGYAPLNVQFMDQSNFL
jgi:PKD repeat protein